MPQIDLFDDAFLVAPAGEVVRWLGNPEFWARCWPGLELVPYHDRGAEGVRWYVQGALVGTAEVWLEPYRDGTLVHVFLRADPPEGADGGGRRPTQRQVRRQADRYARALKGLLFAVKDRLEADRAAGTPPPERGG